MPVNSDDKRSFAGERKSQVSSPTRKQCSPKVSQRTLLTVACAIVASSQCMAFSTTKSKSDSTEKSGSSTRVQAGDSILLQAMSKELDRSFAKLKTAGSAPLYFMAYRVYDTESLRLRASYGALEHDDHDRRRLLDIESRVGSPQVDSSHKLRDDFSGVLARMLFNFHAPIDFSLDDNEDAIRNGLWYVTDGVFKTAQRDFIQVKANRDVKVSEEDPSADFSAAEAVVSIKKPLTLDINPDPWRDRLRRLSAIYKQYPEITQSYVGLNGECTQRCIVTTEGSRVQTTDRQARVVTSVTARADDGMVLNLYDNIDVLDPKDLPEDRVLEERIHALAKSMLALRKAQLAEPYVGPAILRGRAAGVFFHEVLGHRVEGHRQKDEEEGRTFAKKVNQQIMPEFISVFDDPTLSRLGKNILVGHYDFDNEGVKAQRVSIVDRGILRNFLMGRSPINKFNQSNGHCRAETGRQPVARQGNLIVESSKHVPYEELRKMLVEEAKRQGKPYGLIFDEIAGGFAITHSFMPQSFQLLPLRVTRVWADGRPDEILRGVNLVGTPLASLETIMCAGEDIETFNGVCGAESGWVPVSATAPSLLVRTLEVAREWKQQDKPPILPAPLFDKGTKPSSAK